MKRIVLLAIFVFPLSPTTLAFSQNTKTIVLKVYLNAEDKGEYFLQLTPERDVLFSYEDMKELGLESLIEKGEQLISLKSLSPALKYRINEEEAALYITADPLLLPKHTIEIARERPTKAQYIQDNTGFLNYSINYHVDDDFNFSSLFVPWEVGANIGGHFGFSSFSYRKTDLDEEVVRLFSNITEDDPVNLRRLVLGDFSTSSGILGSGGTFGGLFLSKNFSIDPYLVKSPGLQLSGFVETPSEMELYVNDVLVRKIPLSPGEYDIVDYPYTTGSGEAVAIIKDAYGREEVVAFPFYLSTRLLGSGIHEYSYGLGFRRKNFGRESFDYGDLTFMGFHRYGFYRTLTAGLRAELDPHVGNVGPTLSFLLGDMGEVNTSFAVSKDNNDYGCAGFFNYNFLKTNFSTRLSLTGLSENYSNLAISASDDKTRFAGLIGFGVHYKSLGSISATYSTADMYRGSDRDRATINYSRRLFKYTSLNISASRTYAEEDRTELFVNLFIPLGARRSASVNYSNQGGMATEGISIQKNPPLGTGLSYRMLAERRENYAGDRDIDGTAFVEYRGLHGVYSIDAWRSNEINQYAVNASGGIAYINKSLYLSRPIRDSFALVDVSDLEGVKVLYNNQAMGETNSEGEILVPELMSYYDNRLSIETKDIPVNYELKAIQKNIITPFRGGGVVKFDVEKLQAFIGRLFFIEDGKRSSAEYAGLEILVDGKTIEGLVGKRGEFYLENIPSGRFPARAYLEQKECTFDITIPKSDEIMVDMGDITCEVE